jgi:NTP pyrophosphatase (non-canonical NTP hydrolase)
MTPQKTINDLVTSAHQNAIEHGFWEVDQNIGSKSMLIVTELAEFFENYRKNHIRPDDHLPAFANSTIELSDVIIRIFDLAGHFNMPLGEAIMAKMEFNKSRPYLHGKKF